MQSAPITENRKPKRRLTVFLLHICVCLNAVDKSVKHTHTHTHKKRLPIRYVDGSTSARTQRNKKRGTSVAHCGEGKTDVKKKSSIMLSGHFDTAWKGCTDDVQRTETTKFSRFSGSALPTLCAGTSPLADGLPAVPSCFVA